MSAAIREPTPVRRLRQIAEITGARRYLEIGVFAGRTFNALDCFEYKVGVDPEFRFDPDAFATESTVFRKMTSDRFFLEHAGEAPFDVIFLDGLHVSTQTLRDLCNSMMLSHGRTVWLIDDVLPSDPYSAWPVQSEAIRFRRRAGRTSPVWHGDVYKVMLAVHDYFPLLSYATITGSGNPQAILWRQPRHDFTPALGGLEAIERFSYFDLLKRMDLLNCMTEQSALQSLSEWRST